ncbi:DUF6090 family protein [Winogradskyella maritima]|uniref:DUF6090 family protein n=1 Tax=Winogradskyella maritima TaxID=1517766 RepID=A0ABV8AJL5_9FLAO|nr:DUF6090 family protein [Winogradskyella maritima]
MIKLFRQIRRSLIEQNKIGSSTEASAKVGNYFKYAIGEILLVVIGILIALQINNWNERKKTENSGKKLFNELYDEYSETGEILKHAKEGNDLYISFLESTLNNWNRLDLETLESFKRTEFQKNNLSILFVLTSYSQFNDPKNDIFKKSIADGTISLVDDEFAKNLSSSYRLMHRLDEMITQEYDISKEITLHIGKTYSKILNGFKRETTNKMDSKTLDLLLKSFRTDGTLKYLLNAKLEFAESRSKILSSRYQSIQETLKAYSYVRKEQNQINQ